MFFFHIHPLITKHAVRFCATAVFKGKRKAKDVIHSQYV